VSRNRRGISSGDDRKLDEALRSAGRPTAIERRTLRGLCWIAVDFSTIGVVIVGLVGGAVGTAVATWIVSRRLNDLSEYRQLQSALWLVITELHENSARIRNTASERPLEDRVLLGDWVTAKVAFASLAWRNPDLCRDVTRTYGQISDFRSRRGAQCPTDADLDDLARRLEAERDHMEPPGWV
jgi:hypothetical protein